MANPQSTGRPAAEQRSLPSGMGWADWAVSIVNGVAGDYLDERQNGLAIGMALYHAGRPLPLTPAAILAAHPQPTAKICVLIHGLGCHEGIWSYPDPHSPGRRTSYGAALQEDLRYTPFYVRYNTGLALAANGEQLADLLEAMAACYPSAIEEIVLIGHSMGGLVARSACHIGLDRQDRWVGRVTQVFYIASPHEGAALAQVGHWATTVLHAVPHPIAKLIGDLFNRRSQGVKDLATGTPLHPDESAELSWLPHARHYLIGGTLSDDPQNGASVLFGDGLVHPPWAHLQAEEDDIVERAIPAGHVKFFAGLHHLQLPRDPAVYEQIKAWCAPSEGSV